MANDGKFLSGSDWNEPRYTYKSPKGTIVRDVSEDLAWKARQEELKREQAESEASLQAFVQTNRLENAAIIAARRKAYEDSLWSTKFQKGASKVLRCLQDDLQIWRSNIQNTGWRRFRRVAG